MIALVLYACSTDSASPTGAALAPASVAPPVATAPELLPPELVTGADATATPASVLRLSESKLEVPNRHLEVRVDFDHADFATVRDTLVRWGFTVEDGDGASLRVLAPAGDDWSERLEPLPALGRVTETLGQDTLASGAVRGGSARFGPSLTHTWEIREGGIQERMEGGALPAKIEIPRNLPAAVVRCLAPVRMAMVDGESEGPGWERAVLAEPLAWVVVLDQYGACGAGGWFVARADAAVDNVTVAGQPVKALSEEALFGAAISFLSTPRAGNDDSAIAAVDILRRASDDVVERALAAVAPGAHQERLLLAYAERDEQKAIAFARTSGSATVLAWAAGVDANIRAEVLAKPDAGVDALVSAMSAWRPELPVDQAMLSRLQSHADPRVRMRANDLWIDATTAACTAKIPSAKTLELVAAKALYAECPQQPVRLQAFSRLAQLDKNEAAVLVSATLRSPETVRTGIAAVRAANGLERDDLLEALVASPAGDRDVRAEALRTLLRVGRSASAAALAEKHGPFLGVKPPPVKAVAGEK